MPMTLVVMRRPSEDSLTICFEPMKNMKALKKRVRELDAGEAAAIKAAKKAVKLPSTSKKTASKTPATRATKIAKSLRKTIARKQMGLNPWTDEAGKAKYLKRRYYNQLMNAKHRAERNGVPLTTAKPHKKHVLSEAGRKRIAEGQRKRWAAKKTTGNLGAQPVARKKAKK